MNATRLILVGGFLGAGKTTLLARAARQLAAGGKRVGLITNDQAANLVDTAILAEGHPRVREVSGGCFCCRFEDLVNTLQRLVRQSRPDVVICEPVGSCTDLAATVIRPIKKLHGEAFRIAPLSVLVDPSRALEALSDDFQSRFPDSVVYIYRKQLEEADLIVLNKIDTLPAAQSKRLNELLAVHFPGKPVFAMSAMQGEGVSDWLEFVGRDGPSGQFLAEVDYDEYADGEAALGWLNAVVRLRADHGIAWHRFCRELLDRLRSEFRAAEAEVAHVKLRLSCGGGELVANFTRNDESPLIRGTVEGTAGEAALVINVRAHIEPDRLRTVVEQCLHAFGGDAVQTEIEEIANFAPARPEPTYRFDATM